MIEPTWRIGTINYSGEFGSKEVEALILEGGLLAVHRNPNHQPQCCAEYCECTGLGEEFVLTHVATGLRIAVNLPQMPERRLIELMRFAERLAEVAGPAALTGPAVDELRAAWEQIRQETA